MSERTIAILGGPESGKSTFLGALADALAISPLEGLEKSREPEDARPTELLTEPLLDGRYMQRTKGERLLLELPLVHRDAEDRATEFILRVGDYDGEEVERLFANRIDGWSSEWQTRASANALLLFLRPAAIVPLPLLRSPARFTPPPLHQAPFGSDPSTVFGPGISADEPPPRIAPADEPLRIPTMLALVELLQFIRYARGLAPGERPRQGELRVAVLLSAWDVIKSEDWGAHSPSLYLAHHMPLLVDFLWSNFYNADVFCFGLSSTGGDLNDESHRQRYLQNPKGFVAYADVTGTIQTAHDLGLPIRWALFGDAAMRKVL